jgi:hypothetical protein
MKKQNKLTIKVRDLEPLRDVMGGRRRGHGHQLRAGAFVEGRSNLLGEYTGGLGPFGFRRTT